ncbi:MAG: hypothetical protein GY731_11955 [Gammaproteobacteria bacterium]|nr:hypothetical protein [Gammaproteobacteria bacterium]
MPKYKPDVAVKKPPTVKPAGRVAKQLQTAVQVPESDPIPVGVVPESPELHYVHQKLKVLLSKLGEGDVGEVKRTNRIAGGRILPGQKLVIHPRASYYLQR